MITHVLTLFNCVVFFTFFGRLRNTLFNWFFDNVLLNLCQWFLQLYWLFKVSSFLSGSRLFIHWLRDYRREDRLS